MEFEITVTHEGKVWAFVLMPPIGPAYELEPDGTRRVVATMGLNQALLELAAQLDED